MSPGLFDEEIHIVVPLEPISVNHYAKSRIVTTRDGKQFISHYVTKEAEAFMYAVAACAAGRRVVAKEYEVSFCVFQGKGSRGDL